MNRLVASVVVALFIASSSAFGAGAYQVSRTATENHTELAINGVSCGMVISSEGGDPRATVVTENSSGTASPKKHTAGVQYAPITVDVALPLAQPIHDWLTDFFANKPTRRTVLLTQYDYDYKPVGSAMQANNVLLTEVRFPALDASSKDALHLTLVMAPEVTQSVPPATAPKTQGIIKAKAMAADFRIQIGSLPSSRVSKIEAFTIKLPPDTQSVGLRDYISTSTTAIFPNLILSIASSDIADWNTWRDNFIVKGNNSDSSELSGTLDLLEATLRTSYLTLQFSHIGLVRVSPMKQATNSDSVNRFQAEVYFEGLAFGTPAPQPLTALPLGPVAGSLAAAPAAAPAATATNTADQGARDLKDFPRPDNTVRKTFSSVLQKTYQQDAVDYTSKDSLDTIETFYTKNLKSTGWDLNQRYENNNSGVNTHQIVMNWVNGPRTATITMWELKAGGSEIAVTLKTTLTP